MTEDQSGSRIKVEQHGGGPDPRGRPNRWALALVAVMVMGALWSFRGESTPEPEHPVDLDSVAPATTTTTRPPVEGDLSVGWVAVDLPGQGEIVEVVDTTFGLFAVGVDIDQTTLWRSADGISWDAVAVPEALFSHAAVNALLETEFGLVAVGAWTDVSLDEGDPTGNLWERRRPAVWTSVDGDTWERVPDDRVGRTAVTSATGDDRFFGAMNDLVIWEGRLVAVGWSTPQRRAAAWIGDLEGESWRPAGLGFLGSIATEATGISIGDQGLIAVGTTANLPSVWVSADAAKWESADPNVTLGTIRYDRPAEVTAGGNGLVAVGAHRRVFTFQDPPEDAYAIVWLSRDGEEWLRLTPEELAGTGFESVLAADPWLIAAGSRKEGFSTSANIWFSSTGSEWSRVHLGHNEYLWGEAKANVVVRGGPGLVVGGVADGNPELWLWSPDGTVDVSDTPWVRPEPGRWVMRSEFDRDFPVWSMGVVPNGYAAFDMNVAWISNDGVNWNPVQLEAVGLAPGRSYTAPVTFGGTAYLVDESGMVSSSTDGRTWEQLGGNFAGWLSEPRPGADGELLIFEYPRSETDEAQQPHLWSSTDRTSWTEVPLPSAAWISDLGFVQGRYVLVGWSEQGLALWVGTKLGEWRKAEIDQFSGYSGQMALLDGLILLPVETGQVNPTTRILSSTDGLTWELSDREFSGWPGQIVRTGTGVLMLVEVGQGGWRPISQTAWTSLDGKEWTETGLLPSNRNSWIRVLPGAASPAIVIQYGEQASLWEWVDPGQ